MFLTSFSDVVSHALEKAFEGVCGEWLNRLLRASAAFVVCHVAGVIYSFRLSSDWCCNVGEGLIRC